MQKTASGFTLISRACQGFTLIELLVVITIIGVVTAVVNLQINPLEIFGKARDDVRKVDINQIANAYDTQAVGKDKFEPIDPHKFSSGKIPTPPEGGQYQGLLTQDQEYYFICAFLEKGKGINCLLNSENPNCFCRKSKDAPIPSIAPSPSVLPTSTPIGIGTTTPAPIPSFTPSPTPTPSPSVNPTPTSTPNASCLNPQSKPASPSLQGIDGSWCYDSDGNGSYFNSGSCQDSCSNTNDYCEAGGSTVRDGYCSGTWWGFFWTGVHCEYGGYVCSSINQSCSGGKCITVTSSKRVFITSTFYNGNLGGLSGADAKCQNVANTANLGGVWKAWLSDNNISVSSRLDHFNGPYKRIDGVIIANNWADLTDGPLINPQLYSSGAIQNPINIDEKGRLVPEYNPYPGGGNTPAIAWTGTRANGESETRLSGNFSSINCSNWTFGGDTTTGIGGDGGQAYATNSFWTDGAGATCSGNLQLYCFEQ